MAGTQIYLSDWSRDRHAGYLDNVLRKGRDPHFWYLYRTAGANTKHDTPSPGFPSLSWTEIAPDKGNLASKI